MKSVKGKLLKKLKSIKPVGYLNPDRVLQAFAIDGSYPKTPDSNEQPKLFSKESDQENIKESSVISVESQPDIIDVTELMEDLEADDEEMDSIEEVEDKENIRPAKKPNIDVVVIEKENVNCSSRNCAPLSEIDVSCFRKPDLNSCTLFDPNLLAAFEQAVEEHMKMNAQERRTRIETETEADEARYKIRRIEVEPNNDNFDPLLEFEEKCPTGGDGAVVFYTTNLTGIRKTFEDCNKVRFLLENFRVIFYERDVSKHMEYREELWDVLRGRVMPPRLFIKGRYIGGADQVLTLHEQGKLKVLFNGIPVDSTNGACEGCGGVRFVVCFVCNGSHRIVGDDGLSSKCLQCNENGLIICPLCC